MEKLLKKYDQPGPRYTSYPPATQFHQGVGAKEYLHSLEETPPEKPLSLYVHIPFCQQHCAYCGCYVIPTLKRAMAATYVKYIEKEAELVRAALKSPPQVRAVHLGGGTPTYLSPSELDGLMGSLQRLFGLEKDAEISVELDPRVTGPEHLEALKKSGTNRLSIGVQDTSDEVQEAIGRFQSRDTTLRFFELCRTQGFNNINVDLVYGLPHQTKERFRGTLLDVLSLRPERIAVFGYAHVPWVRSNQKKIDPATLPGAKERIELYLLAHEEIAAAGYRHVGMDHFALPGNDLSLAQEAGRLGRNFMGYTAQKDLGILGFGVSAIGGLSSGYFQSEKKLSRYFDRLDKGQLPIERGFLCDQDDLARRFVIHEILCRLRVDYKGFLDRFQVPFSIYFAPEFPALLDLECDGLMVLLPGRLEVTSVGRLFLRNIAMVFDRYLRQGQGQAQAARYSRTV